VQTLIYLRDFDHWFQQLPLRQPGVSRDQCDAIRDDILAALEQMVSVTPHELASLQALTHAAQSSEEFILTLDGGTYFSRCDFSFAMTRAVTRLGDVLGGRTIRVAREGAGQFWTQVDELREVYEKSERRDIVLCDDGIDTGKSLVEVVRQLGGQYLDVRRIRVLLNPHALTELEGIPVETLLCNEPVLWTHERDMFWGSPGGGVSLCRRDNINVLRGVPYSLAPTLLGERVGIEGDVSILRQELLRLNHRFWRMLSQAAGRDLRIRDNPRLQFVAELQADFDDRMPITSVIDWLLDVEPDLSRMSQP